MQYLVWMTLAVRLLVGCIPEPIKPFSVEDNGIIAHKVNSDQEVQMQIQKLEAQLLEDVANEMPPFGAESIKLARQLGSNATSFLLSQVEARGDVAFLSLEALREADFETYNSLPVQTRAEIYVNVLQNNVFYNAWGLPGYQLTATSHALISLGEEAIPLLIPLLEDQRSAPLSGSRDATTSNIYGNRICDYAWIFINEIRDEPYTYSQDSTERDQKIERLRQELQK